MKLLFLTVVLALSTSFAEAQNKVKLSIDWKFVNLVEGYDHECKMVVYIDGVEVGQSSTALQSKHSVYTVDVEKGKHAVRIVNMAYYEGNWEEHNKANDYSVDAFYEGDITFKKKPRKVSMVFDIDAELTTSKVK